MSNALFGVWEGPASQSQSRVDMLHALGESRFPQSLCIEGIEGIGKTALAVQLALRLSCEAELSRPCGKCFACRSVMDPGSTDRWLVPLETKDRETPEKISEATSALVKSMLADPYDLAIIAPTAMISVDQVRLLWQRLSLKSAGVRTIIIPSAERMNDASANALLKTLEEAPPRTHFILTTANRSQLLRTIQSRCLPLALAPLSNQEIAKGLTEQGASISADLLGISMGSLGKAKECMRMDLSQVQGYAMSFFSMVLQKSYSDLFLDMQTWQVEDIAQAVFFLECLGFLLQDCGRQQVGATLRCPSWQEGIARFSISVAKLDSMLSMVQASIRRIQGRKGTVPMVLQTLALQMGQGQE